METGVVEHIVIQLCFPPKVRHFPPNLIWLRHIATLCVELYVQVLIERSEHPGDVIEDIEQALEKV